MRRIAVRNFLMTAMTILICITIFSSLLLFQLYQYSVNEKFKSLRRNGQNVSPIALLWMTEPWRIDTTAFKSFLKSNAKNDNLRIMVSDSAGNIEVYADKYSDGFDGGAVSGEVITKLAGGGEVKEVGTFGGYFKNKLITVAIPISDANGNFRGAVIVSAVADSVTQVFRTFMRAVLVITAFVMLIASALIYFVSQKMTAPLKEIAVASRRIAMGDFTARVRTGGADEINELVASFNYMAENVEKLEQLRGEFVANVSHELKTPMTTISGFVDGILDGTIPEERREYYLHIVSDEVKRLSRMVQTLLLASRLNSGAQKLNITNIDITSVIGVVLVNAEQKIEARNIAVEVDMPEDRLFVFGDEDALTQVMTNLVDNAVKYGEDGGSIRIEAAKKGDKVSVSVFNTGKGISKEDLPFVFDRFYKSDRSRGMDKQSTGLGLYIVKAILKNLGQTITAESEPGKFARFTFTLEPAKFRGNPELKS